MINIWAFLYSQFMVFIVIFLSKKNRPHCFELTINTINTVEDEPLKSDLISVMSVISSKEFSKEMLKKYVRREMLMKSALYQEWIAEEREEASIKRLRIVITELLIEKFDYVTK